MVEVEKNLEVGETDSPAKECSSLEEGEHLLDSSSDITYTEETETGAKHNESNTKPIEESQLPPSKWTNLARAFRFGLSHDTSVPQTPKDEMKAMDKRGSLGKMFRHSLHGMHRPNSAAERAKSEFDVSESPVETSQGPEKGIKWNFFKHGKSHHLVAGSSENEDSASSKDDAKRRPLSRILHIRSKTARADQDCKGLEMSDGTSLQGQLPSSETKGHSLGKLFRYSKNTPNLKQYLKDADKELTEKKSEIDFKMVSENK